MKKNIALLMSIIALISLLFFLRVQTTKNPVEKENILNGTQVSEALYRYDLETENQTVNGIIVKDSEVYYLLMDVIDENNGIYNYKLKKLDIYVNEVTEEKAKENVNSYCNLTEENIECINSNTFTVYNYNFEEIFSYSSSVDNTENTYLPYKDIYILLENNNLSLIINNNLEPYRKIKTDLTLYYENSFLTSDNTYILFIDEEGAKYLYDVNEDILTKIEELNYFKYENGFVFYDEENIKVYDLKSDLEYTYDNDLQKNYFYTGTLSDDNKNLYLYDLIENKLWIENLDEKTMQELDSTIMASDNPIATLKTDEDYLYIYVLQDEFNFYVLDLKNLNLPKIDLTEYKDELTKKIDDKIAEIKDTYNVNVNIKEDAVIKFPDFSAEVLNNNELILESLTKIEKILSKYDKEFFDSFYDQGFDGLNLYLTGTLTPSDYETQVSNPAAYSLTYQGKYMIAIDLNQSNLEELLCHELLHNLEFNLNNKGIYPFSNWTSLNPIGFSYDNSYTSTSTNNYTILEENKENVYFIDYYSHTYETEDRARVFENICACDSDSIVNDYPNLYKKGSYLKEEITKYFPNLNNTSLFNSLN